MGRVNDFGFGRHVLNNVSHVGVGNPGKPFSVRESKLKLKLSLQNKMLTLC